MKHTLFAVSLFSLAISSLTACQTSQNSSAARRQSQLQALTDSHLALMRHQADMLAEQLMQLNDASGQYCLAPSGAHLQQAQQQWRHSFAAWTAMQGQSGGPLDAAGLSYAFQFWPDKKDTVAKQVQRELAAVANGAATPDRGVVTTLNAVEYLLNTELSAQQRCLLLPAISQQLLSNAQLLQDAWQDPNGYQQQLSQMQQQGGETPLLTQAIAQLAHGYDRLEKKLVLPLNTAANPRPLFAESWRSQQSLYFLRTSLIALQQEYRQGGLRTYLVNTQHQPLVSQLDEAFKEALSQLPPGESLAPWLIPEQTEDKGYGRLLRFKLSLDQLGYQLKQVLPSELGLSLGFNATDGD